MWCRGMLGKTHFRGGGSTEVIDQFPTWFIEGTAQMAGAGGQYLHDLTQDLLFMPDREPRIKDWLKRFDYLGREAYAQGYLASLYLSHLAGGDTQISSANFIRGLDKIIQDIADDYSLSETINHQTSGRYADYQDFKNRFANDTYQFTLDVLKETGEDQITSPNTASGSAIAPGGMSDTTDKLYNPTWLKSTFFTLDISKMGEYDNTATLEAGH